ncbi:MAG: hypothetical protein HY445_01700 [Candidatus Niyogibacteria bacterium]|nr:hypothetical protein [Candidatus Niyogibacteria bacterium]
MQDSRFSITYQIYIIAAVTIVGSLLVLFFTEDVLATDYTSDNFIIRDPSISIGGGTSTSDSFQIFQNVGDIALGTSSSATFNLRAGFLYFPTVTVPTVTASAGDSEATLTWSAASGSLGWNVGGYSIGQATTAGGAYTYTQAGNVVTKTVTGLTNGTTYYFVVLPEDDLGNRIATSSEVFATPTAAASSPASSSSSGGGGIISRKKAESAPTVPFLQGEALFPDFNKDGKVYMKDFSILLYYWGKSGDEINPFDLNSDGIIDVKDISILFYYFTG